VCVRDRLHGVVFVDRDKSKVLHNPAFSTEYQHRAFSYLHVIMLGLAELCVYSVYDRTFGDSLPKTPCIHRIYIGL
jgi:hypothetical protein